MIPNGTFLASRGRAYRDFEVGFSAPASRRLREKVGVLNRCTGDLWSQEKVVRGRAGGRIIFDTVRPDKAVALKGCLNTIHG